MEGVSGIVKPEQTSGGDPMYEEGRKLYTEEINAAVRGAKAGGATEIVVMDCHGAGGGWTFNSLVPELLRRGLRMGCAGGVDRLHGVPRTGVRRGALRRHARDGRHAGREHEPHRLGPRLPAPLVQRRRGRRDRDQRGALRHVGVSGAARHRRRGLLSSRAGNCSARASPPSRSSGPSAPARRGRSRRCGHGG